HRFTGVEGDVGVLLEEGPLLVAAEEVGGIGEGERPLVADPAGVVGVQMGEDDGVDLLREGTRLLEALEEPSALGPGEPRGLEGLVAEAEVDEDLAVTRLDQ